MTEPLLRVESLVKHFPVGGGMRGTREVVRAVDGVNLSLMPGETLSLVGESGCGKSTTGRVILRLLEPTGGSVWYQGQEITKLSPQEMRPLRSQMQIIFQDPWSSLNPRLPVKNIIGEGLRHTPSLSRGEREDKVRRMMAKVGLRPEHYDRHPHEFSGGQRQRIGIARALIMQPRLVVADEPVSALDVSVQAQVLNLLGRLKDEMGLSYLFISHDLAVVEHISDRIAVMYLGRIVELAPARDLFDAPRHPYTHALFSAAPLPQVGASRSRVVLGGEVPSPLNPPPGCHFHPRCNRAQDICRRHPPVLKEDGQGREVACFFPLT